MGISNLMMAAASSPMATSPNGDPRTLDGDTIFEIGSVSKVFTSLLLADMVNRKEVTLDRIEPS